MSLRTSIIFCILALASIAEAVTPIKKVIQLLSDMESKAKHMKQADAVEFSKFSQFCKDKKTSTGKVVKDAAELIGTLEGDIGKLDSDISELGKHIDDLHKEVTTNTGKLQEAKAQHERERKSHRNRVQDLTESSEALEQAVAVMKSQSHNRKQAASALLQLTQGDSEESPLPESIQRTVTAFLEVNNEDALFAAPEASGYDFQSGGIVDLLEKLQGEFKDKQAEAEKEEINCKNAYKLESQALHDAIENAEADIAKKTATRQRKTEVGIEKKNNLRLTTASHDEDKHYLGNLVDECDQKTQAFKEKQDLRTDEIEAIGKAIEIMKSPEVSGSAEKHLPSALAQASATRSSFVQLRQGQDLDPRVRLAAARFLYDAGDRLRSQRLDLIAEKISVISNPFEGVKKIISDMITHLLDESNQESEQKGFCDKELGTNKKTRVRLQASVDELNARLDENDAIITSTTHRISKLAEGVEALQSAMGDATALRTAEKAKFREMRKDSRAALAAIEAAIAVLKDFYAEASDSGNYKGSQDAAGGVFGLLEVISSDFSTLVTDAKSSEAAAVKTHKDFTADSKQSVAVKQKESEMLAKDKAAAASEKRSDTKDLKAAQNQLLAAGRYLDKLRPTCVDSGISYEDRVRARQEEIESLQEALKILQKQ